MEDDFFCCPICETHYRGKIDYDTAGCQERCSGMAYNDSPDELTPCLSFYYDCMKVDIAYFDYLNHYHTNGIGMASFFKYQIGNSKSARLYLSATKENINNVFNLAREKKLEPILMALFSLNIGDEKIVDDLFNYLILKDIESLKNILIFR